jgi:hypothetical protein
MATKYKLTCKCGEVFWVGKSQAGEQFVCKCGAAIEVPTIRGLTLLEQKIESEPTNAWTRTQGALFVSGVAVLLAGGAVTWWLIGTIPADPSDNPAGNGVPAVWHVDSINLKRLYRSRPEQVTFFARRLDSMAGQLDPADSLRLWSLYRDLGPMMFRGTASAEEQQADRSFYRLWSLVVGLGTAVVAAGLIGAALVLKS